MAKIQHNTAHKLCRHVLKKAQLSTSSLAINKLHGRFTDIRILNNSIPKSGTHLSELYLQSLPGIRNLGQKTINKRMGDETIIKRIRAIKKGGFANAHLSYDISYENILVENDIKMLLLIRNPLDVAISRHYYITKIDKTHFAHGHVDKNINKGINQCVLGIENVLMPLTDIYIDYLHWAEKTNVMLIKYETLIGSDRGGNDNILRNTLTSLVDFIGLDQSESTVSDAINYAKRKTSSTLRVGELGKRCSEDYAGLNNTSIEALNSISAQAGYKLSI